MSPDEAPELIMNCGTCLYFDTRGFSHLDGVEDRGHCRYHPPEVKVTRGVLNETEFKSVVPDVRADDWCGFYRQDNRAAEEIFEAHGMVQGAVETTA